MKCSEFQDVLPDMIDGEAIGEHAVHLKNCPECSELVADLRAITSGAKLLCAVDEPSPRVWANLQRTLEAEGLIRTPSQAGGVLVPSRRPWSRWAWAGGIAAVLTLSAGLLVQKHETLSRSAVTQTSSAPSTSDKATVDFDDEELLGAMSPSSRSEFEDDLKSVNASIQDLQSALAQDPDDEEAREFLQEAYNQKTMVYELAMDRSIR